MRRRTLLIGLGTAAGAGAVFGSGAFSTASADRQITVQVADDADSFLSLTPGDENGSFTDTSGDALVIDISGDDGDTGVGVDTEYTFDGVVEIGNNLSEATGSKYVWTSVSSAAFGDDQLYLYAEDPETPLSDAAAKEVGAGEALSVGLYIDTTGVDTGEYTPTLTVEAADEDPGAPGGGPEPPEETVDQVLLDSVSSLLDTNEETLTDDSLIAIWAESTASNTDEDGDGDAVSYPSDTDIPVVAVDGNVVGLTGPFVTDDTDFANYGNEEFLLNVYDDLLGGSGTIFHDEGHGQFYTLSDNGDDDFQAFADYVENNGYTYQATSDIESALDGAGADAVTITSPSDAFTDSELDALSSFVDSGGAVLLHDQSDFNNFDATDNHNEIAGELGVGFRFNDDQVLDSENNAGQPFRPTTENFNEEAYPDFFLSRDGLGLELDPSESYEVEVVSVTDGDTVDVEFGDPDNTRDTVRIVGIDTPETGSTNERLQEYEGIDDGSALRTEADSATDYAVDQLAGETVTLSFDEGEGLRGNFGRLLGFLELSDGSVYNADVIEDGWARVYDSGLGRHDEYWELEQAARDNGDGIWQISDPAATPEVGDDPVDELFFPEPVEVTGPDTPVSSEGGEALVALDTDANVATIGGPLIEERFEAGEGGPGVDQYGVYPFLTNVIDELGTGTGPVVVDGGHGQFASDFAVSAEDTAYYLRYLEGQAPGDEEFIGLEGVVEVAGDSGPDLLENGAPAARGLIISTPTSALTEAERSAVASYADAGGAVVLLGSAVDTDAVGNFDPLLSDLDADVGFTDTAVTDSSTTLDGSESNPTTSNFDETGGLFGPFTPGSGSAVPDVRITELDDGEEYVVIENRGSTDADLGGWTLSDSDGDTFEFPADTLGLGETAVVTTSQTGADAPPETEYTYDWGSPGSNGFVWGGSGDTATISNADGDVVDTFSY